MNEITINIMIAERTYKLKVDTEGEERVRKAANIINDRIKAYSQAYAYKDHQDLLAMTALQLATSEANLEAELKFKNQELDQKLQQLDMLLSNHLNA
ncbi:MAG: cell division protein ZapA [Bacteroidetes bacterium]|jgi:cell division protein ZapA (FtsZ GTPase activity inhibitor)|nr:cell division protein ZapA [Bacteroidota bacterium]MBU1581002.1 cell division protein ZapA [Bacteroidota bacterium]MBU2559213.1 cell division protein ZapA [Bacteroidota bacterium]MDA3944454.1 cell division protein ZapA [Bacteroidota bacterium]